MDWTWILIGTAAGAVVMFVWLALCWMVLPHHKADFQGVPNSEGLGGALSGLKPGKALYCYPFMGDYAGGRNDPELQARMEKGPNALITMLPNGDCMGGGVFLCGFLLNLVDAFGMALLCSLIAVPTLTDKVLAGAIAGAILGVTSYGGMSNWMFQPWRFSITSTFDRIVGYSLIGIALHFCLAPI